MYDHYPGEVDDLGWEKFIIGQWESIFVGYRSWTGLRKMGRRWSDLLEGGLGCSQEVADRLVRCCLIDAPDRGLPGVTEPGAVVAAMVGVLADLRADLVAMAGQEPGVPLALLDRHARLLAFVQACAFGDDEAEAPAS